MTFPNDDVLKETHKPGLKGLYRVYDRSKFVKSLCIPSFISVVIFPCIIITQQNTYEVIEAIAKVILSIMPSLLGFVLGGYAIIIGFGNEKFMKSTAKISVENPISFYQKFSSVFAFSILCFATALVLAFVIILFSFIIISEIVPVIIISSINYFTLFILMFTSIYSIFQIPVMILNIFTFSQTNHINLVSQNLKDEIEKQKVPMKKTGF